MTEVTLHPADAATASPPAAPPGITRAAGARIDAIGVSQHAGERQILHEVSLSVEPGQLIALAGGSGAGKTTLLEILAGLRAPSAGQVMHDGVRVDGATRHAGVGYVPQDDIIHGEMPLRRTLQYAARLRLSFSSARPRRTTRGSSSTSSPTSTSRTSRRGSPCPR